MTRSKSEQRMIAPSVEAAPISNGLIARYGILNALDVARCVQEQVQAAINQQRRLHPEEWADDPVPSRQPSQPEPEPAKKVPTMPRIAE